MQVVQGCERCLQSHIDAARGLRIGEDEIELARRGTVSDLRYAAMIAYGLQVYREPTTISDEQVEALPSHGFSDRDIVDLVCLPPRMASSTWSIPSVRPSRWASCSPNGESR